MTPNEVKSVASTVAEATMRLDSMKDRKIVATYLTGSRGYRLNTPESDYDLIVIVTDLPTDILKSQTYSRQLIFDSDNQKFDITFYDFRDFYNQISKRSLKAFELLYSNPLYTTIVPKYSHMMQEITNNSYALAQLHLLNLYRATGGLIQKMQKQNIKHPEKHNRDKDSALPFIYLNMIQQQLNHNFPFSIDMSNVGKVVKIREMSKSGIDSEKKTELLNQANNEWLEMKEKVEKEVKRINDAEHNSITDTKISLENEIAEFYNPLKSKKDSLE